MAEMKSLENYKTLENLCMKSLENDKTLENLCVRAAKGLKAWSVYVERSWREGGRTSGCRSLEVHDR